MLSCSSIQSRCSWFLGSQKKEVWESEKSDVVGRTERRLDPWFHQASPLLVIQIRVRLFDPGPLSLGLSTTDNSRSVGISSPRPSCPKMVLGSGKRPVPDSYATPPTVRRLGVPIRKWCCSFPLPLPDTALVGPMIAGTEAR
jgi:hypothetical protein